MTAPTSGWEPPSGTRPCQHCMARIWKVPLPATHTGSPGGDWADTDGRWYCTEGDTSLRHAPMPAVPPLEEA